MRSLELFFELLQLLRTEGRAVASELGLLRAVQTPVVAVAVCASTGYVFSYGLCQACLSESKPSKKKKKKKKKRENKRQATGSILNHDRRYYGSSVVERKIGEFSAISVFSSGQFKLNLTEREQALTGISFTLQVSPGDRVGGVERVFGGAGCGGGGGRGRGRGRTRAQRWRQEQSGCSGAGDAGRQGRQHPRMSGRSRCRPARRQVVAGGWMLVRVEIRVRPGGRVEAVAGSARELGGRALRRAVPQYPVDAADRWGCRVAADP